MNAILLNHMPTSHRRLAHLGAALLAIAAVLLAPEAVQARQAWERLDVAREAVGDGEPRRAGIDLELPLVSEDGAAVPLTVRVASPMQPGDFVETLQLFATGNPNPEIAAFRFSAGAGKAEVSTRVRLNESQTVIAVARSNRGDVMVAEREVRITVSGCLMRSNADGTAMGEPRVSVRGGAPAEVRTLINHPMETGLRKDAQGEAIPRYIIQGFRAEVGGEAVFEATLYPAVSANPYLRFFVAPKGAGELRLVWTDDTGATAVASAKLAGG
jgi:sulfur-oxidizing protein SoxY